MNFEKKSVCSTSLSVRSWGSKTTNSEYSYIETPTEKFQASSNIPHQMGPNPKEKVGKNGSVKGVCRVSGRNSLKMEKNLEV